ncbi:hypothetical protein ACQB60_40440 [Actinomycetota bacterium Odt1-20B]
MNGTWWLMRGDTRIGELQVDSIDQPWFLCRFTPGPGWGTVRAEFEAKADLRGPDPDGLRMMQVIQPIMDLGLTLVPADGGLPMRLFKECIVWINGDSARLRY